MNFFSQTNEINLTKYDANISFYHLSNLSFEFHDFVEKHCIIYRLYIII